MKLTLDHIDQTIRNLGRLMPAKPNKNSTREYSLKESIFLMAPKLLEMRDMGFTGKELVSALADEEIVIKGATLNRYLCEYQKQTQEKTESGLTTEANPEQTSSAAPNPAVGANPEQATGTKSNPVVGAESEQATATKSERTTDPGRSSADDALSYPTKSSATHNRQDTSQRDKYPTQNQYANRPKPSTWPSEKEGGDDEASV